MWLCPHNVYEYLAPIDVGTDSVTCFVPANLPALTVVHREGETRMDDPEIIEISSSPEPAPIARVAVKERHPKNRNQRNQPYNIYDVDVIELSDSDDDKPTKNGQSTSIINTPIKVRHQAEAGPSRRLALPAPSPGSSRANRLPDSPHPFAKPAPPTLNGSLPTPKRFPSPQATPLFLASDEDEQPYHEPLPFAPLPIPVAQDTLKQASSPEQILKPVSPPPDIDPIDTYVARVLEIIPDVQPAHVHTLLMQHIDIHKDGAVELVLHNLFEDSSYPKIDKKGKRKREEVDNEGDERGVAKTKIDYGDKDRVHSPGQFYVDIALEQLLLDFPYIPKPHVRRALFNNKALYAPTYLFLAEEKERTPLPYNLKTVPSRVTGKGKAKHDPDFDKEREWLLLKLQGDVAHNDAQVAEEMNEQEYEDCGDGIECGCCFSTYPFDKMIQCPDCHLFCSNCMTSYASGLLGAHDPAIVCMDQSGCKLAFPESELHRFLTPKLLELYERVKLRKEIETAGLENLEECPFCEYKVVIENEEEKLFRCESEECGAVTCRECKKPDHLPKSCKEMEEDKHLDARHAIEEAMTRALMRNCPNCQKAFIKEYGCNKMTCPNCQTISCYICRKIINGYEHFDQRTYPGTTNSKKCILSDPVEQRHTEEVTKAAKEALEEYKRRHPNMDQEELKAIEVDLPAPPAPQAPVAGPVNPFAMPRMGMPMGHGIAFAQAQMAHAAQMQQFMAQPPPQPNPAFFNFNINFEQMLPRVAPPVKHRGRRRR